MRLKHDPNLRRSGAERAVIERTHTGQASWAIGPDTCGVCDWFLTRTRGYGGRCGKRGSEGPIIPADALSCKHFEAKKES